MPPVKLKASQRLQRALLSHPTYHPYGLFTMTDQSTQIIFRRASIVDIDQLVVLRIRQLLDEGYPEVTDIRRNLSKYFQTNLENGSLICWVGVADEILLATAGICFYQLPPTFSNPSGRIAYITNMYTDPSFRQRETASLLLNKLILEAKALEYTSVRLHASQLGKGLYEKAGFIDADGFMAMKF